MAVSGKTAAPHEIPYYLSTDKPPDLAAVTKAMADRVHGQLDAIDLSQLAHGTAGQLIVVQGTGAAAYKALKGDATLAEDGTLTIGNEKVTLAKIAKALGLTDSYIAAANKDGEATTPSMRTLGTGAKQAAAGNDARLSDERTPKNGSVTASKLAASAVEATKLAANAKELFPQLLSAGAHKMAFGTVEVEFGANAGPNFSFTATVTHGLGATPRVWLDFVPVGITTTALPGATLIAAPTSTQFELKAWSGGATSGGLHAPVHWLAIT